MMKPLIFIPVSLLLLLLALSPHVEAKRFPGASLSAEEYYYGKIPDKTVKDWTRIILLTPRSGPAPIFFVSPTKFEVHLPQVLIDLTGEQYVSFVQYSRSNRCELVSKKFLPSQVLEVSEHTNGHTQVLCRMSMAAACRYLGGMGTVHNINWMERKWKPLRRVRTDLRCE